VGVIAEPRRKAGFSWPVSMARAPSWERRLVSPRTHNGSARSDYRVTPPAISASPCVCRSGREHTELHRAVASMSKAPTQKVVEFDRMRHPPSSADFASKRTRPPLTFQSILFATPDDRRGDDALGMPVFFADLNCDQIVDAIAAAKEEYNLKPFFYDCLRRLDAVTYRHEVMQDLENTSLLERVNSFARQMREMRSHLHRVQKMHYKEQKQAWFLDAVEIYCDAINAFADDLFRENLKSCGFLGFADYLACYASSVRFRSLLTQTKKLKADLARVKYCVLIKGSSFTVRKYDSEIDYSVNVEETFEKFKQGAFTDYRVKFSTSEDMNHIEAKVAEFVAKLHPEVFVALDEYCARNVDYLDETVAAFDREIQFYIAYLDYTAALKRAGLRFCYPRISDTSKEVYDYEGFDIALAHKLHKEKSSVVCNDFHLKGKERVLVVSGPNQGGKTTFARAFGQLHYLASIGCPVPGSKAQLFLFDNLFTHFEREEKVETLRGKLEDDLIRVRLILNEATSRSVIVINEIFTSTTLQDEIFLSTRLMDRIIRLDVLGVWVTFVDELASFGPQAVSMVSTIDPENPALRTFKIVRRPADGLAYAMAIAQKHRLTYDLIIERIKS
jgi:DNA mismatch repair protein MutS